MEDYGKEGRKSLLSKIHYENGNIRPMVGVAIIVAFIVLVWAISLVTGAHPSDVPVNITH